jgi:hypothetical protein
LSQLNLIYHFQASHHLEEEFLAARYRVIYCFTETGFVENNLLLELLKAFPEANQDMTFVNLDDLKAFAQRVCQELGASQVRILSVQDFNIGIDGARDLHSFREIFEKFGDVLINENVSRKKGLWGRFF